VVRGAFAPERVVELERAFDVVYPPRIYQARPAAAIAVSAGDVWQILGRCRGDAVLAGALADAALAGRACALLDARRVKLLQDTLLLKPPRTGGPVDWHQDYTYTGYLEPPRAVSLRLALSECSRDTGCLEVLDGSHRWGFRAAPRIFRDERVRDVLGELPPELAARVDSSVRPVELAPGDLSIHHCLTLHRSLPNASERPRKTLIAHVFDGDCTVARERLPHPEAAAHFALDAAGHLDEASFPTLFRA
jgi:ectoine hydroxylase-related dioxygenase (phytanoyl-CoA dioxygenase family)